jgi:predicted permease
LPAWRAIQIDPEQAIKEGESRMSESRGAARLTQALVAFQVAVSLVLLVGAVAFVTTLANLRNIDPGFRNQDVLTLSAQLPEDLAKSTKSVAIWNQILETIRAVPDVRSAGLATFTPLSGRDREWVVTVRGYQPPSFEDGTVHIDQVSHGYFESLSIPLLRGRLPDNRDTASTPKVAVINESAARKYFRNRDPIGESLDFIRNGEHSVYRIVGVVRDTKHMSLREASPRFAFIPIPQARNREQRMTLVVASTHPNGELALLQPIRARLMRINPGILISDVITMRHQVNNTLLTERLVSGLSAVFGVLALVLASVGLYGVLSYRIGRQHRSIGIRMALGATPFSVAFTVLRESILVLSIGFLAGLPFAFWMMRTADNMLWGVRASDARVYIGSAALLYVVGTVSAYLPSRRASAIEPAIALRQG